MSNAATADGLAPRAVFSRARAVPLAVAALTAFGLALRIAGASGDLWLDEIWSFQSLEKLGDPGKIFYGISQDNNHFLNSLWLWTAGPFAPPALVRAASIAFGAACIPLAARIARRAIGSVCGDAAGLAAAALFACAYGFVHFGSEARGYAGMMFALLWAFDALDRWSANPADGGARLQFGLAAAFGALCHLEMLPALAALGAGAVARAGARRGFRGAVSAFGDLASPAILGAMPALLCVGGGILYTHKIQLGDQHPFTFAGWLQGLGALSRAALGLCAALPDLAVVGIAAGLAVAALALIPAERRWLPASLIFALPIAEALAHLPNMHFARFHLAAAVGLALLLAEAFGAAWGRGGAARLAASGVLAAIIGGNAIALGAFYQQGRGAYSQAVARMTADGPTTYATNMRPETARVVRFYAEHAGAAATQVPADACGADLPAWFIQSDENDVASPPPETIETGGAACRAPFRLVHVYPAWGLSGFRWALYGRFHGA